MASPLGSFEVNKVMNSLADGPYAVFGLAITQVIISSSHVEINLDVGHKLLPKAKGESGFLSDTIDVGKTVD